MFKFNFAAPSEGASPDGAAQPNQEAAQPSTAAGATVEEVPVSEARHLGLQEVVRVGDHITLLKSQVSTSQAAGLLGRAEVEGSDLLPGQYEGGFKVWEGGVDLADYVARLWGAGSAEPSDGHEPAQPGGSAEAAPVAAASEATGAGSAAVGRQLAGRRVLELGCGHALPGLVALLAGAEVHFQDYNREVLQTVTIPNVTANWEAWRFRSSAPQLQQPQQAQQAQQPQQPQQNGAAAPAGQPAAEAVPGAASGAAPARFFSGDWGALGAALAARGLAAGYDVVLSAETIYSLDSMRSLYACIRQCLRRPGGVAYIAAKSYYFGVGGGTTAFLQLVEGEGEMRAEVVQVLDDGLSNKREILRLCFSS